jgi:hypothetical protein
MMLDHLVLHQERPKAAELGILDPPPRLIVGLSGFQPTVRSLSRGREPTPSLCGNENSSPSFAFHG